MRVVHQRLVDCVREHGGPEASWLVAEGYHGLGRARGDSSAVHCGLTEHIDLILNGFTALA